MLGVALRRIYPSILGLIGLLLIAGGVLLVTSGGSFYYVLAGTALLWSAWLSWCGRRESRWVYAGILTLTVAWAIWEAGFSGWSLMPRLVAWIVVGAWMLTPWFTRTLRPAAPAAPGLTRFMTWGSFAVALLVAVGAGAGLHALDPDSTDPIYQAGFETAYPASASKALRPANGEWRSYGNDTAGTRFSTLGQITPANVADLKPAWKTSLATGDISLSQGMEMTPIMIGDTLYGCNGANDVFAIDAETGKERWRVAAAGSKGRTCRGVAFYRVPGAAGLCAERIITTTGDAALMALDARSGAACPGFGTAGRVDLLEGLSKAPTHYYYVTSAPRSCAAGSCSAAWCSTGNIGASRPA